MSLWYVVTSWGSCILVVSFGQEGGDAILGLGNTTPFTSVIWGNGKGMVYYKMFYK